MAWPLTPCIESVFSWPPVSNTPGYYFYKLAQCFRICRQSSHKAHTMHLKTNILKSKYKFDFIIVFFYFGEIGVIL